MAKFRTGVDLGIKPSYPVQNMHPMMWWMNDDMSRMAMLLQENKKAFEKIYGPKKCGFYSQGTHWYVWELEYGGYAFNVMTSKEGTRYEIVAGFKDLHKEQDELSKVAQRFLQKVFDELLKG